MLDRLISAAGAVTDAADRSVRLRPRGSRRGFATTRPGSLLVAAIIAILAVLLVLAGLEATDPATPVPLEAGAIANAGNLHDRTYTTLHGSFSGAYVETYLDANDNGVEDPGETGISWFYWFVDPTTREGVTVRSQRPPDEVLTFKGSGVVVKEPGYAREVYRPYTDEASEAGLSVDGDVLIDTTGGGTGASVPLDLAGAMPAVGTAVDISGSRLSTYLGVCTHDSNRVHDCEPGAEDAYEIIVFDRLTRHAVRVLVDHNPEFLDETTLTGSLRRNEHAVDDATTVSGYEFADLRLDISDRYVLDDAAGAGSAPLAFALAGVLFAVAAVILFGLAGGYVIYRRSASALPVPASTLGLGERIPLRISGIVRTPTGLEHVREAPGALVRFALGRIVDGPPAAPERPMEPDGTTEQPTSTESLMGTETPTDVATTIEPTSATDPPIALEPTAATDPSPTTPIASTLIVEREGFPHGVSLGRGEVERLSAGDAMVLQGPRPAIRVVVATGPLMLSFDTGGDRERAAAEVLEETDLGLGGRRTDTP